MAVSESMGFELRAVAASPQRSALKITPSDVLWRDSRYAHGADGCVHPDVGLSGREILFFQDAAVVQFVACNGVRDGADAYFVLVGDAVAHPGLLVQVAQQGQRCPADCNVVFAEFAEGTNREGTVGDVVVLLETLDRSTISAGDPQGAVGKDAFGIADVAQHFFRGPLLR